MQKVRWQNELGHSIRARDILSRFPKVAEARGLTTAMIDHVDAIYPIGITPTYADRINWNDHRDPLLKIVFPDVLELDATGMEDQSGERLNTQKTGIHGLQHKYGATVLLTITGVCAAYCRYCFRRRFVGTENETVGDLDAAFRYIETHPEISNVLLSGGDSFMASNRRIAAVLERLRRIDHVGIIRFGTKMVVYLPSRFDDPELLDILRAHNLPNKRIYVISHIDHPQELGPESLEAHRRLVEMGISIRSQTVLMSGVNDDPATLSRMYRQLSEIGVVPYYIFQCRPVKGAAHYALPLLTGSGIVETAKVALSGLAKTVRYMMSHVSGKIEIVSVEEEDESRRALFKYHQARDPGFLGMAMGVEYREPAHWLDDILAQQHAILFGGNALRYARAQIELL